MAAMQCGPNRRIENSLLLASMWECTMTRLLIAAVVCSFAFAGAAQAGCKSNAADKKLAGAALTSFMKKCEKDVAAMCDKSAADKKLAGAAKTSHIKKCVADNS
jgi:hypothetical protein